MTNLREHCWEKNDNLHVKLKSTEASDFIGAYDIAMGSMIKDLPLGLNRRGTRSFHKCFEIGDSFDDLSTNDVSK
ncbi:uncharacterized protein N7483_002521 [Penicillium malachiteum]|uniref:uncharacterized protein n=1 Tax=Penicillium malachiteum TaxID=1324776 RepID=UPI002548DBC3|nr:uncharacterized protein N7483_002521 [Penicillium malachiteum]KAJ5737396.1 hypothetical protein N7483_002521 [Penicillium malachiteum]